MVSAYAPTEEELDMIYENLKDSMTAGGYSYDVMMKATSSVTKDLALAADWVRAVTMPEDNRVFPVRYHDANAQLPSAALGVITPYAFAWQAQPPQTNATVGPSDNAVFLFDDHPGCIACFTDPNASVLKWEYIWTWNGNTTMRWDQDGKIRVNRAIWNNNPTTNWDPHGLFLYCQADQQDNRYIWNDVRPGTVRNGSTPADTTYTLRFPGITSWGSLGASVNAFQVYIYRYLNGNPRLTQKVPINPTSAPVSGGAATITVQLNNASTDNPNTGEYFTFSDYYTMKVALVADVSVVANVEAYLLGGIQVTQTLSLIHI